MPGFFTIAIVFLLSAVALFCGVYYVIRSAKLKRIGVKTEGVIYRYEPDTINNSTTYYPVVRFTTEKGEWITAKNNISGYYLPGKKVTVYYNPHHPNDFVIDTLQNILLPYLISFIGAAILIAATISLLLTGRLFSFT